MRHAKLPTLLLALLFVSATSFTAFAQDQSAEAKKDLKRVSVKGKVEKIEGQRAVVKTDDGKKVTVHLGPQKYWREKGYRLPRGAQITVDGWGEVWDDDGGYMYAGGIHGDGFSFEFMDSEGYPYWASRDDWRDEGWYPCGPFFELYFGAPWGHGPYGYWGPPPHWWHRPHWWGHGWHDRPHHRPHHRPYCPPPRPHHHRGHGPR